MGNSLVCATAGAGDRLVTASRTGDAAEAESLLARNPGLARYSTFAAQNSPLHFAAAKGHVEIVALLLEKGADVNSRNYSGLTPLMQACRFGHWEVVQALILFRCNVSRAAYFTGQTALHFAAAGGHVRCIRLLVADFVPSTAALTMAGEGARHVKGSQCSSGVEFDQFRALSRLVNKVADGGLTPLHMAAVKGNFDCVQLLLDFSANVSATTFNYCSYFRIIGAGSTPLHFAAFGGDFKCCQVLLARGACRLTLNSNGCLPVDVSRMWGRQHLVPLLSPNSVLKLPQFTPSSYLSLPLMSILNIARECGLQPLSTSSDDIDLCAICLERTCSVAAEGCAHELCVKCALCLCSASSCSAETVVPPGAIPCPLCRNGIISFAKLSIKSHEESRLSPSQRIYSPRAALPLQNPDALVITCLA